MHTWFVEFEQFLVENGVKDCPSQIWNADEAGFPLCPKTGRVIAMKAAMYMELLETQRNRSRAFVQPMQLVM